jgi:ABC-type transporter Mla subunit MlaD
MGQFGFININLAKSSDPEMERRIIENVAGYGKQLGRVIEVLDALLVNSATAGWSADQKKALADFLDMAREIAAVKGDYIAPTKANVDRFLEGIRQLKEKDEKEYGEVVERLRKELLT